METKITLKKEDVLKVKIYDEEGNDTGNTLEFDLQDISLPMKYQQVEEEHKKNLNYLKMSFALIDKKPNHEGKKLLSSNEEEKYKVLMKYLDKEIQTLDIILGKGGTEKLLNGRQPYYEMFDDILSYLEPLEPYLSKGFDAVSKKLKDKYKKVEQTDTIEA